MCRFSVINWVVNQNLGRKPAPFRRDFISFSAWTIVVRLIAGNVVHCNGLKHGYSPLINLLRPCHTTDTPVLLQCFIEFRDHSHNSASLTSSGNPFISRKLSCFYVYRRYFEDIAWTILGLILRFVSISCRNL